MGNADGAHLVARAVLISACSAGWRGRASQNPSWPRRASRARGILVVTSFPTCGGFPPFCPGSYMCSVDRRAPQAGAERGSLDLFVFKQTLRDIEHRNAHDTATYGVNMFSDLTEEEFNKCARVTIEPTEQPPHSQPADPACVLNLRLRSASILRLRQRLDQRSPTLQPVDC